jgi:predicted DNA-binding transcriptional regulator AlpA
MNDPKPFIFAEAFRAELKEILREVLREELADNTKPNDDEKETLLTVDDAAALIGVNRRWMYRHAHKLPFTRRINRKTLRFTEAGLRRWLAAKKPDSRR